MAESEQAETRGGRAPPYVSFKTFKTLVHDLHEHDIPLRIDRSVLPRFSGVVGSQLIGSLRFLRLVDDDRQPSAELKALVKVYGTDEWAGTLSHVLHKAYEPLFTIDLSAATPSQFHETFRKAFPGSADAVAKKSTAFFLQAAQDAGIQISPRILKGSKPRSSNGAGPRRRGTRKQEKPEGSPPPKERGETDTTHPPKDGVPRMPTEYDLLKLLDPDEMSEPEANAVWTLIQFIRRQKTSG